jgi:hypothetical protein
MIAYIKKTERSQINDLMLHLKLLEKQEQANPKTNRKREIVKRNTMEIQEIIRDYFENLYSNKLKIMKKWRDF